MEKLMEVVQTLRKRIDEHESELSQSEAQTRYSLVDPLLRALGWDTADPKQVAVEYPVDVGTQRDGRADYTLFVDEKREVVIEAKRLNTLQSESMFEFENKPEDDLVAKGIRYCAKDGIPYLLITDGRWWHLYDSLKKHSLPQDKWRLDFDIKKGSPEEVCKKVQELAEITRQGAIEDDGWIPLARIDREDMPSEIRFPDPDRTTQKLYNWKDLLVESVKWLEQNDKSFHNRLRDPIVMLPNGRPSLVAKKPEHRNGKPWGKKYTEYLKDANVYVYTKCGKDRTFKYAKRIIEEMGFNPDKFAVRYAKS